MCQISTQEELRSKSEEIILDSSSLIHQLDNNMISEEKYFIEIEKSLQSSLMNSIIYHLKFYCDVIPRIIKYYIQFMFKKNKF